MKSTLRTIATGTVGSLLTAGIALTTAVPALAAEGGDIILRSGYAFVDPDNGASETVPGAGGTVSVDPGAALGLTMSYMLDSNWAIGVLAATPFSHDIDHSSLGEVGETKHLPPTVTAQYHFNLANQSLKPYVGLGFNYTNFFEEKGKGALAGAELELDDSFGLALEAGVDYALDDQWGLSMQLWYIDIDTDASINGGQDFEVEIDPVVYMLGVSYSL